VSSPPSSKATVPLADALSHSAPLASLLARIEASRARLDTVRAALPEGLADHVRAGPLDDAGWTLLVGSGGAAAKLRQCLPGLRQALAARGWAEVEIRVKVRAPR
jgi:hypothetical protein